MQIKLSLSESASNMSEKKHTTPALWADPDDVPELTDAFFKRADYFDGPKLIRRGSLLTEQKKQSVTIRYDADVVTAFKATGAGWQTRMNDALREWLKTHAPAA